VDIAVVHRLIKAICEIVNKSYFNYTNVHMTILCKLLVICIDKKSMFPEINKTDHHDITEIFL
jgi:hypothetical protein